MMWQEWAFYWFTPLILAMEAWLVAVVCLLAGRRRAGTALAILGLAGLWVASTPQLARSLTYSLESRYPAVPAPSAPVADAILVLGGAVIAAHPPERPDVMLDAASTRVLHAAELYRHQKAKWIVVAAGNRPQQEHLQREADAIADLLVRLGVPPAAIVRETESQTTRENARNAKPILERLGVRRVLLVTSAAHMPRAMQTFVTVWGGTGPELIPSVTDVHVVPGETNGPEVWFPSLDALLVVTKCLKEFAGMVALAIIS